MSARDTGAPAAGSARPAALRLDGIVKRFGAVTALDEASLELRAGTLHALLGENGAGKTTLMRVAFGMLAPDAGRVTVDGVPRRFASPADAMRAGVGMVHQHFTIVPTMTVAENVALGGRGRYDAAAAARRVGAVGAAAGLSLDPHARAGELGVAGQQRLEIVKALAREARVLVLDEPTAVLTPLEARELLGWLRGFVDGGRSVVLITHKLRDALAFADDVTVLRRGRTVAARPAAGATEAALADAMLGTRAGRDAAATDDAAAVAMVAAERRPAGSSAAVPGEVVLHAHELRVRDERGVERVKGASLEVRAGEIVGIAAVEGSGQHELLRALAGRAAAAGGTLRTPPRVGFVPEDRQRDALLLDAPLYENVALRDAGARGGVLRWRAWAARTARLMQRFDVRAGGPAAAARALSGGNQQKLVVARELGDEDGGVPPAVVAENPTRGLDIRATAAVHARLRAARDAGAAVVVYSSDLDEVLLLADRVLALYDGQTVAVPAEREAVGRAMLGGQVSAAPSAAPPRDGA